MYPIETYARLYDEVVERRDGKNRFDPAEGTVWRELGAAEQRMVREQDADLWDVAEAYAEDVAGFDRAHHTLHALPEERGDAYVAALPDDLTAWEASSWRHLSTGEDTIWLRYWVMYNVEPINCADGPAAFERKLRDNLEPMRAHDAYNADAMKAVYDGWDAQGRDWAAELWTFVTDDNLGLKELAEERSRRNEAVAARAQELEGVLGARLDRHADPPSWWKRLRDAIF